MIHERFTLGKAVLYMDSSYLTEESRKYLRQKKVMYVASITRNRLATIVNSLETKLEKSGTHVTAYNKKTKEAATYCWSINSRIGKKFVHATRFEVVGKAQDNHVCPLYDQYCMGLMAAIYTTGAYIVRLGRTSSRAISTMARTTSSHVCLLIRTTCGSMPDVRKIIVAM